MISTNSAKRSDQISVKATTSCHSHYGCQIIDCPLHALLIIVLYDSKVE